MRLLLNGQFLMVWVLSYALVSSIGCKFSALHHGWQGMTVTVMDGQTSHPVDRLTVDAPLEDSNGSCG